MSDDEEEEETGALTISDRRQMIWDLAMPVYKPTEYSTSTGDKRTTSTKLDPAKVSDGRVPGRFKVRALSSMGGFTALKRALRTWINSETFPSHLFGENGELRPIRKLAEWEAQTSTPSGEAGLSHFIKTSIFDLVNYILSQFEGRDRTWKVIGIGGTGKTDWGFFLDGVLVCIVEIKPHCVSRR